MVTARTSLWTPLVLVCVAAVGAFAGDLNLTWVVLAAIGMASTYYILQSEPLGLLSL